MASIKQLDERRFKITVSNGYRPNGKKISKAKTIQVPPGVPKRGIGQYVAHAAEELERTIRQLRSRIKKIAFAERGLSSALPDYVDTGQLSLPLDGGDAP